MAQAKARATAAPTGEWLTPELHYVQARGLTFRVARWHVGAGMGSPPLLFLNGIGADADTAAPLLRRIIGREVWTLDMPGTGGSPDCFWPYSVHSMANAVMDVADHFGEITLDLAGFSWGGALAQQIAGQFPQRIGRLILLGTASQIGSADIGWGAVFDHDVVSGIMRMPVSSALGLTYQSLAMAGWSNNLLAHRIIDRPIMVISGTKDHVVPAQHGSALADQLQARQHLTISGGHLFPFTKAQETAQAITAFLDADRTAPKKSKKAPPVAA